MGYLHTGSIGIWIDGYAYSSSNWRSWCARENLSLFMRKGSSKLKLSFLRCQAMMKSS